MARGKKYGGRAKGTPNAVTANAREAIALFVDGNIHRLQGWLDAIAENPKQGPSFAYQCLMDLLEYHVPKLARTELAGADGGPLGIQIVQYSQTTQSVDAAPVSDESVVQTRTGVPPLSSTLAPKKR